MKSKNISTTCKYIKDITNIDKQFQKDEDLSKFFVDIENILEKPEFDINLTIDEFDEFVKLGLLTYREVIVFLLALETFEQA